MKTKQLPTFEKTKESVIITIPVNYIAFLARHNPETPLIVKDKHKLSEFVLDNIQNRTENSEGLGVFYEMLDFAIMTTLEDGEDCVKMKNEY